MKDILGCHVSFNKDKQMLLSIEEALSYGANTFMFYTGAPQNTNRSPINDDLIPLAHTLMDKEGIDINNVVVHAPYIINMANKTNYEFNVNFLKEEINRVKKLGVSRIVIHPGSHVGQGVELGIQNIIDVLNEVMPSCSNVTICLETMAGKGSEVGVTTSELKQIIDGVKNKDNIGVCIDTCHLHDGGYDLNKFDEYLEEFDSIIGLDRIKVVHVNDSKNTMGSHKDRHENIGIGNIGFDILNGIVHHEKLKDVPKILETPFIGEGKEKYPPYYEEIKMLNEGKFNDHLIDEIINHYTAHNN